MEVEAYAMMPALIMRHNYCFLPSYFIILLQIQCVGCFLKLIEYEVL